MRKQAMLARKVAFGDFSKAFLLVFDEVGVLFVSFTPKMMPSAQ
jgi:hypothetical protein